jgi:hypothetical protein
MHSINNFYIDKKVGGHKNCLHLKNFIEKFIENETYLVLDKFSKILEIPIDTLKDKSKQIVTNQFSFKEGKFVLNFSTIRVSFDYCIFLFLIFSQLLKMKSKKNTRRNINFMLDGVDHVDQLYRFKNIINNFNNNLILVKKNLNFNRKEFKSTNIFLKNIFFKTSSLLNKKFKKIFIYGYQIYRVSLNEKFNFFKLINVILNSSINYNYLFNKYDVKILLHDRFFNTCPIRNYFLKKLCNGKSAAVQVHLAESAISLFIFSEIIFTIADEQDTKNKLISLGGDIKFSYAVGSLKMEHLLDITSAKDSKKYFSDILIIGINITDWYHTSSITAEAYYKFLKIIKEISLIFPKKKIIYKHHPNFKWNKLEAKILNNSNIKIIIDKKEIKNEIGYILNIVFKRMLNFFFIEPKQDTKLNSLFYGSYRYLLNSQFIISFGSTMILEALKLNRNAFFINPDSLENPYFEKLAHLDKYIISDLKNLKDKFDNLENSKLIESKEKNYIEGSSSKLICTIIDKITHS